MWAYDINSLVKGTNSRLLLYISKKLFTSIKEFNVLSDIENLSLVNAQPDSEKALWTSAFLWKRANAAFITLEISAFTKGIFFI